MAYFSHFCHKSLFHDSFVNVVVLFVYLLVCLFVWGFMSNLRIFQLYGNVTVPDERLQILTYARHL